MAGGSWWLDFDDPCQRAWATAVPAKTKYTIVSLFRKILATCPFWRGFAWFQGEKARIKHHVASNELWRRAGFTEKSQKFPTGGLLGLLVYWLVCFDHCSMVVFKSPRRSTGIISTSASAFQFLLLSFLAASTGSVLEKYSPDELKHGCAPTTWWNVCIAQRDLRCCFFFDAVLF